MIGMTLVILELITNIVASSCQWTSFNGDCKQCSSNLYLYNGTCVATCPDGYVSQRPNWVFGWKREIGGKCEVKGNFGIQVWGRTLPYNYGGTDPSISSGVVNIFSNGYAFAALELDGSVQVW